MKQSSGFLAIEMVPEEHCDFSIYLAKRARALSGACAEVQIPDSGTELWYRGNRNISKKELRFQHLPYQESESSFWRMCRGVVS
jgi:hypothetical protein